MPYLFIIATLAKTLVRWNVKFSVTKNCALPIILRALKTTELQAKPTTKFWLSKLSTKKKKRDLNWKSKSCRKSLKKETILLNSTTRTSKLKRIKTKSLKLNSLTLLPFWFKESTRSRLSTARKNILLINTSKTHRLLNRLSVKWRSSLVSLITKKLWLLISRQKTKTTVCTTMWTCLVRKSTGMKTTISF